MNIIIINKVTEDGKKNVAVALDYKKKIDNNSVSIGTFSVAGRTVINVYTNDRAEKTATGTGMNGQFIIIELSLEDENAFTKIRDRNDTKRRLPQYAILQIRDILFVNGDMRKAWDIPALVVSENDELLNNIHQFTIVTQCSCQSQEPKIDL